MPGEDKGPDIVVEKDADSSLGIAHVTAFFNLLFSREHSFILP